MDWITYKQLCDRPDYWSRWMLEQCIDLLQQLEERSLAAALDGVLAGASMDTPADHRGGTATEMYRVALPVSQRQALLQAISGAQARNLRTQQTKNRGLAGFVEVCRDFAEQRSIGEKIDGQQVTGNRG